MHILLVSFLGLAPVVIFLLVLRYLDSFKLVTLSTVAGVLVLGALAGVVSYFLSGPLMDVLHLDFAHYSRYAAPALEESLKAAVIVYLLASNRIGFMIDAAILGVAVGAGFALFENIYYATVFTDANMGVWMIRGLGTAIMHGGTAAIFAVTAQNLSERHTAFNAVNYIPGLIVAISIHTIFNQFDAWPLQSTAVTIFALPLALLFVFDKSEHEAHDWLLHDYQSHETLLVALREGTFAASEAGRHLAAIAARFGEEDTSDIFAYLGLHTRLVLDAEKMLLARESGEPSPVPAAEREKFARLHALERRLGRTALLTLWPHLKFSQKELWELHRLEAETER